MAGELKELLREWIVQFIRNRNIMSRDLEGIEAGSGSCDLIARYKDRTEFILAAPIGWEDISRLLSDHSGKAGEHAAVVMLNNKENIRMMLVCWEQLKTALNLKFIFINPFSSLEKKWIIYPATHDRISDSGSLKKGIESLFASVEEISEEEFIRKSEGERGSSV